MAPTVPAIYYMAVIRRKDHSIDSPTLELSQAFWLSDFSWLLHSNYKQAMSFGARTLAERTGPGVRRKVEERNYNLYALGTNMGVCGIIVANAEYPAVVAGAKLSELVNEFTTRTPVASYRTIVKDPQKDEDPIPWPALKEMIKKWQKPELTPIQKMQQDLEETKTIITETMESVLERGEKIDNLVAKSDALSSSSKMFYTQAKKQNSCCVVM